MLKGVNRQVVEIAQPENQYFEKIILFVKPEFGGAAPSRLAQQANKALAVLPQPPKNKNAASAARLWRVLRAVLCACVGAGLLALLELIFR